jgi:hypothetical protein
MHLPRPGEFAAMIETDGATIVPPERAEADSRLLTVLPAIEFKAIPLVEAMDILGDRMGMASEPNLIAIEGAGIDKYSPVTMDIPAGRADAGLDALTAVASTTDCRLDWRVVGHTLRFTKTGSTFRSVPQRKYRLFDVGPILDALKDDHVTLAFDFAPLNDGDAFAFPHLSWNGINSPREQLRLFETLLSRWRFSDAVPCAHLNGRTLVVELEPRIMLAAARRLDHLANLLKVNASSSTTEATRGR